MKTVRINCYKPFLPEDGTITHKATSYRLSKGIDFNEPSNIVLENLNDKVNKYAWEVQVDVPEEQVLYCIVKFTFSAVTPVGTKDIESDWSSIITISNKNNELYLSDSIIETPEVNVTVNEKDITISSGDFKMWNGMGLHTASSFLIKDTDNIDINSRLNDEDNLKSITIENNLEQGKIYLTKVKHHSSGNGVGNYGNNFIVNQDYESKLFAFQAPEDFVINRKFYYRIKLYLSNFKSYDLDIRNVDNHTVFKLENQTQLVKYFLVDTNSFSPMSRYNVYLRLNLEDGRSTEYEQVKELICLKNTLVPYIPSTYYPNSYNTYGPYPTNGIACMTTRELFDGCIVIPDSYTSTISLYKKNGDAIAIVKTIYQFERSTNVKYINIIQLPNRDILLDLVLYTEGRQSITKFMLFDYNPIKYEFKLLGEIERPEERYTTSITNSLVVNKQGKIYYIPSYLTDKKTEERQHLKLKELKITYNEDDTVKKFEILDTDLPVPITANPGLMIDRNDQVYFFGGSYVNRYNKKDKEEYWLLDNRKVFKVTDTKQFEEVATIPDDVPNEAYALQPFLRLDGEIVLFNATYSGTGVNFNKFTNFDPNTNKFTLYDVNGTITVPFRNNLVFRSGDIYRISSKEKDPQVVFTYNTNMSHGSDVSAEGITDLVVNDGEVIFTEDLYKYASITILGTGILKWVRPQGITELTSTTWIVTKDTKILEIDLRKAKYDSILVLDGAQLQITAR